MGNINSLDPQTYRQIRYYSVIGPSALPPEELDRVSIYNICCKQGSLLWYQFKLVII